MTEADKSFDSHKAFADKYENQPLEFLNYFREVLSGDRVSQYHGNNLAYLYECSYSKTFRCTPGQTVDDVRWFAAMVSILEVKEREHSHPHRNDSAQRFRHWVNLICESAQYQALAELNIIDMVTAEAVGEWASFWLRRIESIVSAWEETLARCGDRNSSLNATPIEQMVDLRELKIRLKVYRRLPEDLQLQNCPQFKDWVSRVDSLP